MTVRTAVSRASAGAAVPEARATGGRRRARGRRAGDDTGSGTVLTVGLVAVVAVLLAALALLVGAQGARARAQAGADLAALAAAQHLLVHGEAAGAQACALAGAVAQRNDVRVSSCRATGGGVVEVSAARASVSGPATARARAGPVSARG